MTATPNPNTIPIINTKQETAKQWLHRRLCKRPSQQSCKIEVSDRLRKRNSARRPRTAPSSKTTTEINPIPIEPTTAIDISQALLPPSTQIPSQPPRTNSGVVRDVNAWLDTSVNTSSPPLMGGITYWRTATVANPQSIAGTQHAIPIVHETDLARPSTSNGNQTKVYRRRPKKFQVQMPLLSRNSSQRAASRKQINRRSNSVPVLGIPYEVTEEGPPPAIHTRTRYIPQPMPTLPEPLQERYRNGQHEDELPLVQPRIRYDSPASTKTTRTSEGEGSIGRRMQALFGRNSRSTDCTRPSTAGAHLSREDSTGHLSEAPTYSSGPPPPSYRSRPVSILSTSSFGCIDGMNPEQRQLSQQRAAYERSMKCRLKRFARNFTS